VMIVIPLSLGLSVTKYQSVIVIMNGSDDLPLIPTDLEALGSGRRQIAQKLLKTEGRQLCKICVLSFCHISGSDEKTQS
jgi:hypothetical protein